MNKLVFESRRRIIDIDGGNTETYYLSNAQAHVTKDAVSSLLLLSLLLLTLAMCIVIIREEKPQTSASCKSSTAASGMVVHSTPVRNSQDAVLQFR